MCWEFYQKPVASNLCLEARSALPWKVKIMTLVNDIERRMRNCDRDLPMDRRAVHLTEAMAKMARSGYSEEVRAEVLVAGLKAYYRNIEREEQGAGRVNRPATEGADKRRAPQYLGSKTWYKEPTSTVKKPQGQDAMGTAADNTERNMNHMKRSPRGIRNVNPGPEEKPESGKKWILRYESVLFVPATPHAALKKTLQGAINQQAKINGTPSVRVVERGGTKILQLLSQANPWAAQHCGRKGCLPCSSAAKDSHLGKCNKESIIYALKYVTCQEEKELKVTYVGDSGRCGYLGVGEHLT